VTHVGTGTVYWITGLSDAGKTSVAKSLKERFVDSGQTVILLDGDELRGIFRTIRGYGQDDRFRLAMSYANLCRAISDQGISVICATISMFHDVRKWNRDNIPHYREIFLDVPLEELRRRDSKGLYAKAERDEKNELVGMGVPCEMPAQPDLQISNYGDCSVQDTVERIWLMCTQGKPEKT